jgi:hypothetical protein
LTGSRPAGSFNACRSTRHLRWVKRVTPGTGGTTFDFDGAAFTHIDGKVTFEVMAELWLDSDAAIVRIGAMVTTSTSAVCRSPKPAW